MRAASNKPQSSTRRLFQRLKAFWTEATDANGVRKAVANFTSRRIYLNMQVPEVDLPSHAEHFCSNAIITSQYTYVNFLPKNLSRQFRRVANIYFLVLTILQLIGYFSLGSRFLTVVPIILVLAITAIKDAFEDWRRHVSDKHFNETPTRVVRNLRNPNLLWQDQQAEIAKTKRVHRFRINFARRMHKQTWYNQIPKGWEESQNPVDLSKPAVLDEVAKWKNVRVGDFVILKTGDPAPADMLMLATSSEDNSCYVETKNLDGETNLKPRLALLETAGVRDAEGCRRVRAVVEADPPSSNMGKFNGSIKLFSVPAISAPEESYAPHAGFDPYAMASPIRISPPSPSPSPSLSPTPYAHSSSRFPASVSGANNVGQNGESYELKVLGPKQSLPSRHSPLAVSATSANTGASGYAGDSRSRSSSSSTTTTSNRNEPSVEPTATIADKSPEASLGKSLPENTSYESDPLLVPFTLSNVLLRGMTVRNTDWIVGVVLYTGEQTKIILNAGPTPYKRSRIERMMNVQVTLCFVFVFIMSFIVALAGGLKYAEREHRHSPYVDQTMGKGIYGFALFWSAMIMMQNIIPIALYISIEFVKSWHAYWIYQDVNMYYEPTGQRCIARNWNISDDLGQVSYIFSDKTGTLTRNVMDFRMCSINGIIYGKQLPGDELDVVKGRMAQEEDDRDIDGAEEGAMDINRQSADTSIISHGTSQYDSSPLISYSDSHEGQVRSQYHAPAIKPVAIGAARSRTRTNQPLSEEEAEAKRRQMIHTYVSAMRSAFEPKYAEIGDKETGEGGSYTFVDPQIFYDMAPEAAPPSMASHVPGGALQRPQGIPDSQGADGGLQISPPDIQRICSHRSISHGFSVDTIRQKKMIDLFLTELATCHSVVIEKSFQKHIVHDEDNDDRSTIRKLTRMFHSRSGSRKITDMVRHRRHRSKHHARMDSQATTTSGGDGVEWVASDSALSRMGHQPGNSVSSAAAVARSGEGAGADDQFNFLSVPGSRLRMGDDGQAFYSEQTSTSQSFGANDAAPAVEFAADSTTGASQSNGQSRASPVDAEKQDMSKLAYSAESPDEGALVRAAKNFGYTFLGRIKNTLYLDIRGESVQYEVLDTIEFNSTRKRMSSILRRPAPYNDIILFSKGADNVMIERLSKLPGEAETPNP
ncbi:hypothetical protein GGI12_003243, partial [Dipsacomyces acuminosporus]